MIKKFYSYWSGVTLVLVLMGGAVRMLNAGLACPDWPLCFGQLVPDFQFHVYAEWGHRALAGVVSLGCFWGAWRLVRSPEISRGLKILAGASVFLILVQVVLGGLTVLLRLETTSVVLHLLLGTSLFVLFRVIYWQLPPKSLNGGGVSGGWHLVAWCLLAGVYVQMALGASVAAHGAGLICGWPICNGAWFPQWTGLLGLQVWHRAVAYGLFLAAALGCALARHQPKEFRVCLHAFMGFLLLQVVLGIANIHSNLALPVRVAHLGVAAMSLLYAYKCVHQSASKIL